MYRKQVPTLRILCRDRGRLEAYQCLPGGRVESNEENLIPPPPPCTSIECCCVRSGGTPGRAVHSFRDLNFHDGKESLLNAFQGMSRKFDLGTVAPGLPTRHLPKSGGGCVSLVNNFTAKLSAARNPSTAQALQRTDDIIRRIEDRVSNY